MTSTDSKKSQVVAQLSKVLLMQTSRRQGLKLMRKAALLVLAVSAAFWVRQTQGYLFFEIYNHTVVSWNFCKLNASKALI